MTTIEYLKDRYLTWRTGQTKDEREYISWYLRNVNITAANIRDMFKNFKYTINVDPRAFLDDFTVIPCDEAKQYFWPVCDIERTAVWRYERVHWDTFQECWVINEIGGEDRIFVATNSKEDATMIALKWA